MKNLDRYVLSAHWLVCCYGNRDEYIIKLFYPPSFARFLLYIKT